MQCPLLSLVALVNALDYAYSGDIAPPALRDLRKVAESALERCDKIVDCHEVVMTRPGRVDAHPMTEPPPSDLARLSWST